MIWSARAAGIQLSINGVNLQRYKLAGVARFLICLIAVCADIQLNQTRSLTLCNDNNKVSTSNYKTNIRIVIIWFAYCTEGFNRCRKRSQISFILQKHLFFWVHYQNIFCWKTIEVISNEMIFDENPPVFIISLSIFFNITVYFSRPTYYYGMIASVNCVLHLYYVSDTHK